MASEKILTVTQENFETEVLKSGASVSLTVKVTRLRSARVGSRLTFRVHVASTHDKEKDDTVAAVVKRVRG